MTDEIEVELEVDMEGIHQASAPRCLDPADLAADVMIERALVSATD